MPTDSSRITNDGKGRAHWFDLMGFGALLALIPLRTIVGEHLTFEVPRMFRHIAAQGNANPGTTMLFSIVIIVVALGHAIYRFARRDVCYQRTGAEIGLLLLGIAGVGALVAAGQKHLALFGAVNLIALVLYAIVLRQFLTAPWRIRLTVFVILATGIVVLAKCGLQYFKEIPDTIAYYEENRNEILGDQASQATGGRAGGIAYDYEQRMKSKLIGAYYPHANVLASQLILFFLAAVALIADRLRRKTSPLTLIAPVIIAAGCVIAMLGTDSKGGLASLFIGAFIAIVAWFGRGIIARRPTGTTIGVWMAGIVGAGIVLTMLHANEASLGRSIQFRHMYWRGAAAMIADHSWFGVGPANFGRHFTHYKPVECPEEVDSPHSWPVELAAEWGIPGLVAFLVILIGISARLSRRGESSSNADPPGSIVVWPLALMVVIFGYWFLQLAGADIYILAVALLFGTIPWLVGFVGVALEDKDDSTVSNEATVAMLGPVVAGLLAFLLHTGVDLAMFEGGPATTFFAMVAVALATRGIGRASLAITSPTVALRALSPRRVPAFAMSIACLFAVSVAIHFLVAPPSHYNALLDTGRAGTQRNDWRSYATSPFGIAYAEALDAYPLDGTAHAELIEQLIPRVSNVDHVTRALQLLDEMVRRDPYNGLRFNHAGTLYMQRFELTHDRAALDDAIDQYVRFVDDYPTSPLRHIYLANALEREFDSFRDESARTRAIEHFEAALDLESRRVFVSQPNRMPPEQVERLRQVIEALRAQESTNPL